MRTLVHLSDLHFGRVDERLLAPLIAAVHESHPDLVVISGDFTQRARAGQFQESRAFLDALPRPQLAVPGNHDIPLYNLVARFLRPLTGYRKFVTAELQPVFLDDEIVVVGVNTARSLAFKGGRINEAQVSRACASLPAAGESRVKVIVTHHPFDPPAEYDARDRVGRARMAMTKLVECGADLFLAGHLHVGDDGHTTDRYGVGGRPTLLVQAGTACSTRLRGQVNSFNVIRISRSEIIVQRCAWRSAAATFVLLDEERHRRTTGGGDALRARPSAPDAS